MNPFDLKSALLARHAQHVVLVHFPIALFMAGAACDFVAQWRRASGLAAVAYYNVMLAAISSALAVATGLGAWQWQLEGQRLKGNLLLHLSLGIAASVMIWLACWLHHRARQGRHARPRYRLGIEAIAVAVLALAAHLGGFLSGVNGTV